MNIVIIGGGPTALGAAYRLNELIQEKTLANDTKVLILEKEHEVGGLARSITDKQGFTWDLGVHILGYSKYVKFNQAMNDAVNMWSISTRCVKLCFFTSWFMSNEVFMNHVMKETQLSENYIPYPVQDAVPYFPEPIRTECLEELRNSTIETSAENFDQLTEKVFGRKLQEIFIRPYNEKVWTIPIEEMNCVWVENRVPIPNIAELERRSKLTKEELIKEEESKPPVYFKYPDNMKGMGDVWKTVASQLPTDWIRYNSTVERIDVNNKKVITAGGIEYAYDQVISTIPITELCQISSLCRPVVNLKYSKVILVGVGLRKPQPTFTQSLSWLYFPQKNIIFYRCTFLSNFNKHMTPDSSEYWSVICEIGADSDASVDENDCVDKTVTGLRESGIISENTEVVSRWYHILPYGYPIPSLKRDEELNRCHKELQKNSIFSRGRFGGWKYEIANQDHSFTIGCEVVDRILFEIPETLST